MIYLTNIDMKQNELQNTVVQSLSKAPENPKIGQIYVDTSGDKNKFMWFNGEKWIELGMSTPEKVPTATIPSVKIKVSNIDNSNIEVGDTVPVSYTTEFDPGSYLYGPDTGIEVSSLYVYDTGDPPNTSTTPSGTFNEVVVGDETDYKITVKVDYTEGAVPLTDQGSSYPSARIPAGTISASTGSISGFRKYFYGTNKDILPLTSEVIRNLTHSTKAIKSGTSFDIPIKEGDSQVIIAFPSNSGLSLSSVIDTGAFNINVYDVFNMELVDVEGANGYQAISYDVYVYNPDVSLGANTYKVTIS